tara:strand:+ start:804 stop:1277 length:474 start_codon:yes stop_codon:yes gene_type:complete
MPTREILMSHPVSTLRAEIAKANLSQKADKNLFKRAVSKMRKDELIAVMMAPAYKDRFHHIKMREKSVKPRPLKRPRYPGVDKAKAKADKAKADEKSKEITITPKRRRKKKPPLGSKPKAKGGKRDKIKLVSFDPPLTATKADGSVKELKKRVKSKK